MIVTVGMNNGNIIINNKINYLKGEQSKDSCVIPVIYYSKSALYTSGRVPFSLFSVSWFLCMCPL